MGCLMLSGEIGLDFFFLEMEDIWFMMKMNVRYKFKMSIDDKFRCPEHGNFISRC